MPKKTGNELQFECHGTCDREFFLDQLFPDDEEDALFCLPCFIENFKYSPNNPHIGPTP